MRLRSSARAFKPLAAWGHVLLDPDTWLRPSSIASSSAAATSSSAAPATEPDIIKERRRLTQLPGSPWCQIFRKRGARFSGTHTEELYAIPERRNRLISLIVAVLETPLISRDPEIQEIAGVDVIG
jgi:hypothetical protein